ncbi:MAG: SpoIID/LytB domain-containing protein [Actinomycetota bacterium]|nr:SpoIID/LytB domain-containing protein [Actinomycetota bacterium]
MIAQITSSGLTAINELTIEEYLYGCVPSEMPFGWPKEALKSQACAARNYAVKNLGKHGTYDLCATTHCQVYLGVDHEKPSTTAAVNETAVKLIMANGSPIIAYYHSTCGGSTENSENVWTNALNYLKAASCPFCASSPHRDWRATFTFSELEAKLNANPETSVLGALKGIEVASLRGERRVGTVKLTGGQGTKEISAGKLREVLGTGVIKSTWFSISGGSEEEAKKSTATMIIGKAGYSLNDVFTSTDAPPYIKGGRTYVPVRYLANALGIADSGIDWSGLTRTATLTKGADIVTLAIGSKKLLKNAAVISMDVSPEIAGTGRTMLPARWVAEAFGGSVSWDGASKAVTIKY